MSAILLRRHRSQVVPAVSIHRRVAIETGAACLAGAIGSWSFLVLPPAIAAAVAIVVVVTVVALLDAWATVLLLLLMRSSLDVFADVRLAGLNVAALVSLLLTGVCLAHVVVNRVSLTKVPLALPFLASLAVLSVGFLYSVDRVASLEDWLRTLSTFSLYVFVVESVHSSGRRDSLLRAVTLSAVVPLSFGLYQLASGTGDHYTAGFNRIYATFLHPSPYAFYLLTLFPFIIISCLQSPHKWTRIWSVVLLLAISVSELATFTRIAWLGMAVTLFIIIMAGRRARYLLLLCPACLLVLAIPELHARLQDAGNQSGSGGWRLDEWQQALSLMAPWQVPAGMGSGAIKVLTGNNAHNDYLRVLVETGVLGAAALAWLYGSLFGITLRAFRQHASPTGKGLALAFLAVLVARLIMFSTDNIMVQPVLEWYFWSLAGLVVTLAREGSEPSNRLRGARAQASRRQETQQSAMAGYDMLPSAIQPLQDTE